MLPIERLPEIVPRLELTVRDCPDVIREVRLLILGADREEVLGRGGEGARLELAPELRPLPLLLDADEEEDDFLRLSLASNLGAAITTAPKTIRSATV